MLRAATAFALACLFLAAMPPRPAGAQVQRCETADGRTVYTDKACADIGATDRLQRDGPAAGASVHRRGCSRTLQDLTFELTMAIDARDTNRVAALYHWPGIGTRNGYAIMERLDAIAQRPLVDARPLFPEEAPPVAAMAAAQASAPVAEADPARPPTASDLMRTSRPWRPSTVSTAPETASAKRPADVAPVQEPVSAPPRRRVPYALQVDQTLAGGTTPSRTVFGLRRHLGCWWISF
jgi:hypothetical protein